MQKLFNEAATLSDLSHKYVLNYQSCWFQLLPYLEEEKSALEHQEEQEEEFEMIVC